MTKLGTAPSGPRTWGDYAAFVASDEPPDAGPSAAAHLDVTQLSTGKAWRIDPEPGFSMAASTYTLDDTWIYFGETVVSATGVDRVYSLHRIRLDKLDAWAKPL